MVTRRTTHTDEDEIDEVHDQYYRENHYGNNYSANWVPILLVALFIVGVLAVFPYMTSNQGPVQNNTTVPAVTTRPDNTQPGPEFGIGGGPNEVTSTPTPTPSPRPSSTAAPLAPPMDLETTREPTP